MNYTDWVGEENQLLPHSKASYVHAVSEYVTLESSSLEFSYGSSDNSDDFEHLAFSDTLGRGVVGDYKSSISSSILHAFSSDERSYMQEFSFDVYDTASFDTLDTPFLKSSSDTFSLVLTSSFVPPCTVQYTKFQRGIQ